jgi:hypothetical protein
MDIPRFERQNVNPRIACADIGDAFQGFVHELLLPEHPQLHRFPGGGKDGGIDLIETSDNRILSQGTSPVAAGDQFQTPARRAIVRGRGRRRSGS